MIYYLKEKETFVKSNAKKNDWFKTKEVLMQENEELKKK